jgi:hypothetical protein
MEKLSLSNSQNIEEKNNSDMTLSSILRQDSKNL